MRKDAIDETGKTYGYWTVQEYAGAAQSGNAMWKCRCVCGTRREITGARLRSGRAISCGCQNDQAKRLQALRKKLKGKPRNDRKDKTYGDFWSKVQRTRGCWNWIGATVGNRYGSWGAGLTRYGERLAHRVSYVIHCGPIPKGLEVMHSCDNGFCVNPKHLSVGTHKDNMQDASRKKKWTKKK